MSGTANVFVRPSPRDLREIPLDADIAMRARLSLTPRELGVWFNLRTHLWLFGELPVVLKRLAAIGGIGARSFENMMPVLAPLFDRDTQGRWRDLDLEAERNKRLDLTSYQPPSSGLDEIRRIDPALSEARRKAGREGSERRWAEERRKRLLMNGGGRDVEAGKAADTSQNDGSENANPIANGIANECDLPSGFAAVLPSLAKFDASSTPGQSVGLSPSEFKEKIQKSDRPTAAGGASAPDGKPDALDSSFAMPGATGSMANSIASETPTVMANASSSSMANENASVIAPGSSTGARLSDDTIIAALRTAGSGKIPVMLLTSDGIAPIRVLLEMGCDLMRDVVPAFDAGARNLTEPLKSLRAKFIHEMALMNRDEAARARSTTTGATLLVFVAVGTPEWQAWLEYNKKKSFPLTQANNKGPKGWYFQTQWPPGDNRRFDPMLVSAARHG